MDTTRSQTDPGVDFVRQAETLIRSLAGVLHARIQASPRGIDAIHVVAADDDAAARMAGRVRSALLAGLATPVVPACIHVRTTARDDEPGDPGDLDVATRDPDAGSAARHRLRLIHGDELRTERLLDVHEPEADPEEDRPHAPAPTGEAARAHVLRARLVAVDIQRPGDGRVVCRVSVAWGGDVHRAEAVAVDLPGAAAQAAAQAAVRALAAAGLQGLELNGLREVEIAGRDYVLVALRRDDGPGVRHRSGSALMFGSPERSAAEAAVDAANDLV